MVYGHMPYHNPSVVQVPSVASPEHVIALESKSIGRHRRSEVISPHDLCRVLFVVTEIISAQSLTTIKIL